jgi:tetratricopeptide (TPR) repeat protein
MKNKIAAVFTMVLAVVLSFSSNAQTLKVPAASPLQTVKQSFALSDITIEYSRPSVKGRVIYGDLVPYNAIWRTGANAATKITFGEDVKVEGNPVKAGTYALYTIPNKDSWDIMFYKDLTLGGNVAEYKTEEELLRIKIKPATLSEKVETFTMNLANITSTTASVELLWDKTRVAFKISTEIDAAIMKNIESVMKADARPYYSAANYYYENDKDLAQALEWITKAAEIYPKRYWVMHLKAKIQLKMKDYKGAITSAEQSLAAAREDKNDDYVKMNEKLIAEAKKK